MYKAIPNTEGKYEACIDGSIRRLGAKNNLKSWDDTHGYRMVNICINNNPKKYKVHRLVAETFLANPESKPCVNHKNGIRDDNRIENLEWVTFSENSMHAHNTGLSKTRKPVLQYDLDMNFIKEWESFHAVNGHGFDYRGVHKACSGRMKTHRKHIWKYKFQNQ